MTKMLTKRDKRVIYLFQFKRGLKAAAAAREINELFGIDTCNDRTVQRWFERFKFGNFDLDHEFGQRGHPVPKFSDEELRAAIEANPTANMQNLADLLGVNKATISRRLKKLGIVRGELSLEQTGS